MFVPSLTELQLEWFVVALSVELRNLHHPCYLSRHHWVVYFIWEQIYTHTHARTMKGERWHVLISVVALCVRT